MGLGYAIRVKRDNPELRVLVLEKAKEPRFKIGESTLSVTIKNLLELGFTGAQYLGERLVHAAAAEHARALADRRADQRVKEAHAMQVKVDDCGLGRRFKQIRPQRAASHAS